MEDEEVKPSTSQEEQVMLGISGGGGEERTTLDIDSDIKFDDEYSIVTVWISTDR